MIGRRATRRRYGGATYRQRWILVVAWQARFMQCMAAGVVATEDVAYLLNGFGIRTGVDLGKLLEASAFITAALQHVPGSSTAKARMCANAREAALAQLSFNACGAAPAAVRQDRGNAHSSSSTEGSVPTQEHATPTQESAFTGDLVTPARYAGSAVWFLGTGMGVYLFIFIAAVVKFLTWIF